MLRVAAALPVAWALKLSSTPLGVGVPEVVGPPAAQGEAVPLGPVGSPVADTEREVEALTLGEALVLALPVTALLPVPAGVEDTLAEEVPVVVPVPVALGVVRGEAVVDRL